MAKEEEENAIDLTIEEMAEGEDTAGDSMLPGRLLQQRQRQQQRQADTILLLTEEIALNPEDPMNRVKRADAHLQLGEFQEALEDAEAALVLGPGHERCRIDPYVWKAEALYYLGEYEASFVSAEEGLKIKPDAWDLEQVKEMMRGPVLMKNEQVMRRALEDMPELGDTFDGVQAIMKLEKDDGTRGYMKDEGFRKKLVEANSDNIKLSEHLAEDERMRKALGILLNVKLKDGGGVWEGGNTVEEFAKGSEGECTE